MPQRGFTIVVFILIIALLSVGIVGGSLVVKNKYPNLLSKSNGDNLTQVMDIHRTELVQNHQSEVLKYPSPIPPYLAFVNSEKNRDQEISQLKLYNLDTKKLINLDPNFLNKAGRLYDVLGGWSPDGKYLAVESKFRVNEILEGIIYFYDVAANKAIQVKQLSGQDAYSSGFNYLSEWNDANTLIYKSSFDSKTNISKQYLVNVNAQLSESSKENKIIIKNKNVAVEQVVKQGKIFSYTAMVNNKTPVADLKGIPVGTTDSYFITLEIARAEPLVDFSNPNKFLNPDLGREFENAQKQGNEEEAKRILEKYSKPKGASKIHLYSLTDGELVNSFEVSTDGWISIEAKIHPTHDAVIAHEQDKAFGGPDNSRYVEISLDGKNKQLLYSGPGVDSERVLTGDTDFEISSDGNWLIFYQPSKEITQSGPLKKVIVLYNLNTKDKKLLCDVDCKDMRIYRSNALY